MSASEGGPTNPSNYQAGLFRAPSLKNLNRRKRVKLNVYVPPKLMLQVCTPRTRLSHDIKALLREARKFSVFPLLHLNNWSVREWRKEAHWTMMDITLWKVRNPTLKLKLKLPAATGGSTLQE
jgi:hypothetical protein